MFAPPRPSAPQPDVRHASATYKGREVEVEVHRDGRRPGSHIVVVVHDRGHDRRVEYITDDARFDDAIEAGFDVAQALVDGRMH
jgi:hypothetical protein